MRYRNSFVRRGIGIIKEGIRKDYIPYPNSIYKIKKGQSLTKNCPKYGMKRIYLYLITINYYAENTVYQALYIKSFLKT